MAKHITPQVTEHCLAKLGQLCYATFVILNILSHCINNHTYT